MTYLSYTCSYTLYYLFNPTRGGGGSQEINIACPPSSLYKKAICKSMFKLTDGYGALNRIDEF